MARVKAEIITAAVVICGCRPAMSEAPRAQTDAGGTDVEPRPFSILFEPPGDWDRGVELRGAGNPPPRVGDAFVVLDDEGHVGDIRFVHFEGPDPDRAPWEADWVANAVWEQGPKRAARRFVVAVGPVKEPPRDWGRVLWPVEDTPYRVIERGQWQDVLVVDIDDDGDADIRLRLFGCSGQQPNHVSFPMRLVHENNEKRTTTHARGFCPDEVSAAESESQG